MEEKVKEILESMSFLSYGWVEPNGVKHFKSKQNYFKEFYRIMTIKEIEEYKVGTCFESAKYASYLCKKAGLNPRSFMINYDDPMKLAKHTFTVVSDDEAFYLVEASWVNDTIKYNSLDELLESVIKRYPRMYKIENLDRNLIHIYEIDEFTDHLSLNEFVDSIKQNEKIIAK